MAGRLSTRVRLIVALAATLVILAPIAWLWQSSLVGNSYSVMGMGYLDSLNGLDGVRVDIAMMRTPDGHGRLELTKFHDPTAVSAEPENAPPNTLGLRSIMFAVDDVDAAVAGLRAQGAELVGEVAQYQDSYRLCYVRGPEGIIVALAEHVS